MINYYLKKHGWNAERGSYENVERVVGPLTLAQVRTRVARLPETTVWLWEVVMERVMQSGSETVGSINAEEFDGAVPVYEDSES